MNRQFELKGLERLTSDNYPDAPYLEDGVWYYSILEQDLKYGKWIAKEACFKGVDGKKFKVYYSDILTGKVYPIDSNISVRCEGASVTYRK